MLTPLLGTLLLLTPSLASTIPPIHKIFTFPVNTFTENIAVCSNGHLLLTTETSPSLYAVSPQSSSANASIVHTFSNVTGTGLIGITETSPDIFALISGVIDLASTRAALGSLKVWTVDFTCFPPKTRYVTTVANSTLLNGISAIPGTDLVLAGDSVAGAIYRIDIKTGAYAIVVQDPLLEIVASNTSNLGINGVKYRDGHLYFTNSAQGIFGRVKIDRKGDRKGEVEVLARAGEGIVYDDFDFDGKGDAWIASHPDAVVTVQRNGTQIVYEDAELLLNPTAAAFGRGVMRHMLFVTNGGQFVDNGAGGFDLVDSGVVAVDTKGMR